MLDSATTRDLLERHHRRLRVLLRALLAESADAAAAWNETVARIGRVPSPADADRFGPWADGIAREVAGEWRRRKGHLPFTDDLCRQLAESAIASPRVAQERPRRSRRFLNGCPSPKGPVSPPLRHAAVDRANRRGRRSAAVGDGARSGHLARDTHLGAHRTHRPTPGQHRLAARADLTRLVLQLLNGAISADSRLVLETLLLADAPAQGALSSLCRAGSRTGMARWRAPVISESPAPTAGKLTIREWLVTITFVAACVVVVLFVILLFTGQLRGLL